MLVKFRSSKAGDLIMYADNARPILKLLGKETLARGVITEEQMADAIAVLDAAIVREKAARAAGESADANAQAMAEAKGDALPISFLQRVVPFVELLRRTLKEKGYVTWEAAGDF